jgi:deazaflavin-dependent oxidoreductase (nitroreductase family)
VQRLGGTRLGVLAIGRVVSPLQRRLHRWTGGRISLTGRAPVLLLTTRGRRTGKERTVPLFYLPDADHLVVCNVDPGFERPNPWTLNLRAEPRARVDLGRTRSEVVAREASADELDRYWPRLTELWPAYQAYADRGGRRSVFVLDPVGR